jgi:hypothetical protein
MSVACVDDGRYNIVVGQGHRVILGYLFIVDAGAMHGIGVLDEYSLYYVSSVQYQNGESRCIPTILQIRVKIEACTQQLFAAATRFFRGFFKDRPIGIASLYSSRQIIRIKRKMPAVKAVSMSFAVKASFALSVTFAVCVTLGMIALAGEEYLQAGTEMTKANWLVQRCEAKDLVRLSESRSGLVASSCSRPRASSPDGIEARKEERL